MTLTFPDGFDPRELTDAQIAQLTRDAWFDRANADLRDAALGADHATLTDADLPDDHWQLPTLEEIDAAATLKLTAAQVAELKAEAEQYAPPVAAGVVCNCPSTFCPAHGRLNRSELKKGRKVRE